MTLEPLKPSEVRLVRDCVWARSQVPNGHFLPAPRWGRAVKRMVERGYLTACKPVTGCGGDDPWPVVRLEQENWDKLRREQPQIFAAA